MKTSTTWKAGHKFESFDEHNSIQLDAERKEGFNPKSLLLSALAACSGIDVVDILTKMRVPFSALKVDVDTEQTDGQPKVFRDLHITYYIRTGADNHDKVIKAIDLSLEKYCGVAAMLRKNSPIDYKLVIEGNE